DISSKRPVDTGPVRATQVVGLHPSVLAARSESRGVEQRRFPSTRNTGVAAHRQYRVRANFIDVGIVMAVLGVMQHVIRTLAAIRFALSTRRDLLLEILALRHQLAVRARPNRRFRRSDRLLWLILRRVGPRWRDALVLVQPANVDRWHRARFVRRWWRRGRRPGRLRIDSPCRDLIGRLAWENPLWGAPRIHGELIKLGVVVSESTVSRYLRERPNRPSQTWRTFLANHLSQFECDTQMLSPARLTHATPSPNRRRATAATA